MGILPVVLYRQFQTRERSELSISHTPPPL
jgi:hypothetical protein